MLLFLWEATNTTLLNAQTSSRITCYTNTQVSDAISDLITCSELRSDYNYPYLDACTPKKLHALQY